MLRRTWSGKRARDARTAAHLRPEDVAEATGAHRATVYRWEAGTEPQMSLVLALCDLYGVSIDSLFVHQDEATTTAGACATGGRGV